VCDTIGAEGIAVVYMTSDGSHWLGEKGRQHIERESLAPMCQKCFLTMENASVARRAAEAERLARNIREATLAVADAARLGSLSGPRYRQACAEHEDDLTAAEEMAAEWGVGNGLFGSRGE
jgi:hypothetical protein